MKPTYGLDMLVPAARNDTHPSRVHGLGKKGPTRAHDSGTAQKLLSAGAVTQPQEFADVLKQAAPNTLPSVAASPPDASPQDSKAGKPLPMRSTKELGPRSAPREESARRPTAAPVNRDRTSTHERDSAQHRDVLHSLQLGTAPRTVPTAPTAQREETSQQRDEADPAIASATLRKRLAHTIDRAHREQHDAHHDEQERAVLPPLILPQPFEAGALLPRPLLTADAATDVRLGSDASMSDGFKRAPREGHETVPAERQASSQSVDGRLSDPRSDAAVAHEAQAATPAQAAADPGPRAAVAPSASEAQPMTGPSALLHDPRLEGVIAPHVARLTVDVGNDTQVQLMVRARDGVADVRLVGDVPLARDVERGLVAALASEGMALGHFETSAGGHEGMQYRGDNRGDDRGNDREDNGPPRALALGARSAPRSTAQSASPPTAHPGRHSVRA